MKANHYTAEQIIKILEQAERGEQTIGAVCREHGVAEATFYRWRKTYGGMNVAEAQRLKELEKENGRLKRLLAERMLEVDALKEVLAKKADDCSTARGRGRLGAVWMLGSSRVRAGSVAACNVSLPAARD
jgi:putative transposase